MNDDLKVLYEKVSNDFDLGTFDDFKKKMSNDADIKTFYNVVSGDYDLGDYDSFVSRVKKKDVSKPSSEELSGVQEDYVPTSSFSKSEEDEATAGAFGDTPPVSPIEDKGALESFNTNFLQGKLTFNNDVRNAVNRNFSEALKSNEQKKADLQRELSATISVEFGENPEATITESARYLDIVKDYKSKIDKLDSELSKQNVIEQAKVLTPPSWMSEQVEAAPSDHFMSDAARVLEYDTVRQQRVTDSLQQNLVQGDVQKTKSQIREEKRRPVGLTEDGEYIPMFDVPYTESQIEAEKALFPERLEERGAGFSNAVYQNMSMIFGELDAAADIIGDITTLRSGGGFGEISKKFDVLAARSKQPADTFGAGLTQGATGLGFMLAKMANAPKLPIGKYKDASKLFSYMTGEGFLGGYHEADEDGGGKYRSAFSGAAMGMKDAMIYSGVSFAASTVSAAALSKAPKEWFEGGTYLRTISDRLNKRGIAAKLITPEDAAKLSSHYTTVGLLSSIGGGGLSAIQQYSETGSINWQEAGSAAVLWGGMSAIGLADMSKRIAVDKFMSLTEGELATVKALRVDPNQAKAYAAELADIAKGTKDHSIKMAIQTAAYEVDMIANIGNMTAEAGKNAKVYLDAVSRMDIPNEVKAELRNKIYQAEAVYNLPYDAKIISDYISIQKLQREVYDIKNEMADVKDPVILDEISTRLAKKELDLKEFREQYKTEVERYGAEEAERIKSGAQLTEFTDAEKDALRDINKKKLLNQDITPEESELLKKQEDYIEVSRKGLVLGDNMKVGDTITPFPARNGNTKSAIEKVDGGYYIGSEVTGSGTVETVEQARDRAFKSRILLSEVESELTERGKHKPKKSEYSIKGEVYGDKESFLRALKEFADKGPMDHLMLDGDIRYKKDVSINEVMDIIGSGTGAIENIPISRKSTAELEAYKVAVEADLSMFREAERLLKKDAVKDAFKAGEDTFGDGVTDSATEKESGYKMELSPLGKEKASRLRANLKKEVSKSIMSSSDSSFMKDAGYTTERVEGKKEMAVVKDGKVVATGKTKKEAISNARDVRIKEVAKGLKKTDDLTLVTTMSNKDFDFFDYVTGDQDSIEALKKQREIFDLRRTEKERIKSIKGSPLASFLRKTFMDPQETMKMKFINVDPVGGRRIADYVMLQRGESGRSLNEYESWKNKFYGKSISDMVSDREAELIQHIALLERNVELDRIQHRRAKEIANESGIDGATSKKLLEAFKRGDDLTLKELMEEYGLKEINVDRVLEKTKILRETYKQKLYDRYEAELLSADGFQNLLYEQPFYTPREYLQHVETTTHNRGKTIEPIRALKEGDVTALVTDPSVLMGDYISNTNRAISRNKTIKAFADFADWNPESTLVKRAGISKEHAAKKIDYMGDVPLEPEFEPTPRGYVSKDYYEGGIKKRVFIHEEIAKDLDMQVSPEHVNMALMIAGWLSGKNIVTAFATGYNPEFAVKNVFLDVMTQFMVTTEFSPVLPEAAMQMGKNIASMSLDIATKGPEYRAFIAEGGSMQYLTQQGRSFEGKYGKVTPLNTIKGSILNLLSVAQQGSEFASRLSLRKQYKDNRVSELNRMGIKPDAEMMKAINEASTAYARWYLDFSEGGSFTKLADHVFPYFNATTRVTKNNLRAAKKDPALYAFKVAQLGLAATAIASYNMGDHEAYDEETRNSMREAYLYDISDRIKARNYVVMLNMYRTTDSGEKRYLYLKFPKDNFVSPIVGIAESAYLYYMHGIGKEDVVNKSMEELRTMVSGAISPTSLIPSTQAAVGYVFNRDMFFNTPLWKGNEVAKPGQIFGREDEYYEGVTPQRFVAMGKATGMSPVGLEYVSKSLFTSSNMFGTVLGRSLDFAAGELDPSIKDKHIKDNAERLSNVYFLRRFLGESSPFNRSEEIESYLYDANEYRIENDHKIARLLLDNKSKNTDDRLNEFFAELYDSGDYTPQEAERLTEKHLNKIVAEKSPNVMFTNIKYKFVAPEAKAMALYRMYIDLPNDEARINFENDMFDYHDQFGGLLSEETKFLFYSMLDRGVKKDEITISLLKSLQMGDDTGKDK